MYRYRTKGEELPILSAESVDVESVIDPLLRVPTDYRIDSSEPVTWYNDQGYTLDWRVYDKKDDFLPFAGCHVNVYNQRDDENYVCFDGVEIYNPDYVSRGYGLAMYLEAIAYAHSQGLPFRTQDYDQTRHAVRIWELLHKLGVAREVTPFEYSHTINKQHHDTGEFRKVDKYKGVYIVDVPQTLKS